MPKFVFMPPREGSNQQSDNEFRHQLAAKLADTLPEFDVHCPESKEETLEVIRDADAAMGWIAPEYLENAKKIKWLHNPDAGPFFGYYYEELCNHPLTITNPRGIYWDHISHHIMMFVLSLSRGLPWFEDARRQHKWDKNARKTPYIFLGDATALINGVGGIGHETARLCAQFGMKVIGIDPRPEHEIPGIEIYSPDQLDRHIPRADFIITTVPHTPETEFTFDSARFKLMKNTAYFINIGRGMVCKLDDLAEAIENGEIAGCGLDVFETEPLPEDHKLWKLNNVLMTPHVAVADADNLPDRRFQVLLENARRFLKDEKLENVVDKSKWY
jgi:phosphoglycerate dehydrogenase-like enzyme